MKKLVAILMGGVLSISASAAVTTVFDFEAGPESQIKMPDGLSWPTVTSKPTTPANKAEFIVGDISIRTSYATRASKPQIYINPDGDTWHYRLFDGNKLSLMCGNDYNIISVRIILHPDRDSEPSKSSVETGGGSLVAGEDAKSLEWKGSNPALTLNANGKLYMSRIEVETDEEPALSGAVVSDPGQGRVVYYNLQGNRVENPSGGTFIRISNGRSEKIHLP